MVKTNQYPSNVNKRYISQAFQIELNVFKKNHTAQIGLPWPSFYKIKIYNYDRLSIRLIIQDFKPFEAKALRSGATVASKSVMLVFNGPIEDIALSTSLIL